MSKISTTSIIFNSRKTRTSLLTVLKRSPWASIWYGLLYFCYLKREASLRDWLLREIKPTTGLLFEVLRYIIKSRSLTVWPVNTLTELVCSNHPKKSRSLVHIVLKTCHEILAVTLLVATLSLICSLSSFATRNNLICLRLLFSCSRLRSLSVCPFWPAE